MESPDTGLISVSTQYKVDPLLAMNALKPGTVGVVAVDAVGRLAGAGFVTLKGLSYKSEERPTAYLSNLVVHPDYRHQGIASQLAAWRVAYASRTLGEDAITYAFIQRSNTGSFATANRWARQRLGPVRIVVVPPAGKLPKGGEYVVHVASREDLEEVTHKLNNFYGDFIFFPRQSTEELATWLNASPLGAPIHHYHVVIAKTGALVAGAAVTEMVRLAVNHIVHMPATMRVANAVLKIVPQERVLRSLVVSKFWFDPGHLRAARYLWESLRFMYRDMGNTLRLEFDTRNPLTDVINLPFYWPSTHVLAVVRSSRALREDKPIYADV